jgi:NADPH:quinone reductase-like Zn-dependent oxidoreductase
MKAIVWTNYGPPEVLQFKEVEKPAPKDDELLIKIHATTVTAGDCEMRSLKLPLGLSLPMRLYVGFSKPQRITILGQELAGEVEAVGKDVQHFRTGDQVFAATSMRLGAYAEYICLSATPDGGVLAHKPANMTYAEAAAVPVGGLEALHFLSRAKIQPGEQVLINGAGGSIGTMAVQLARHFGAEVTAVDSADKLAMLRSLGAAKVIDYTQGDFTRTGATYDVIFDVPGKSSFSRSIRVLKPNGRYLLANPRVSTMLRGLWTSKTTNKQVIFDQSTRKTEELLFLKELIEAGKLQAVIDRRYPLAQIAEAHRYVELGHKKGNVVITVAPDRTP